MDGLNKSNGGKVTQVINARELKGLQERANRAIERLKILHGETTLFYLKDIPESHRLNTFVAEQFKQFPLGSISSEFILREGFVRPNDSDHRNPTILELQKLERTIQDFTNLSGDNLYLFARKSLFPLTYKLYENYGTICTRDFFLERQQKLTPPLCNINYVRLLKRAVELYEHMENMQVEAVRRSLHGDDSLFPRIQLAKNDLPVVISGEMTIGDFLEKHSID